MEPSLGTPQDTDMASPPSSFLRQEPSSDASTSNSHQETSQTRAGPESTSQSRGATATTTSKKQRVPDGYIYQPYYDPSRSRRHRHEQDSESAVFGSATSRGNHASATRILELRGLERRIVQLLETAGQAIQLLSGDDDEEEEGAGDNAGNEDEMKKQDPTKQQVNKKEEKERFDRKLLSATTNYQEKATSADKQRELENARVATFQAEIDEKAARFEALAQGYATLVNEIQSGLRKQFHYLTKAGITSSQVPFKNVVYGEEKELETWLNAVDVLKESAGHLVNKIEHELQEPSKDMDQASQ
ncbi:hypothetical protein BGZ83_010268 [Gryganskiella cystojenkinii]|nr:hypothetical protein BGZ83_010268 [Gryganskiella cystojenkinii]